MYNNTRENRIKFVWKVTHMLLCHARRDDDDAGPALPRFDAAPRPGSGCAPRKIKKFVAKLCGKKSASPEASLRLSLSKALVDTPAYAQTRARALRTTGALTQPRRLLDEEAAVPVEVREEPPEGRGPGVRVEGRGEVRDGPRHARLEGRERGDVAVEEAVRVLERALEGRADARAERLVEERRRREARPVLVEDVGAAPRGRVVLVDGAAERRAEVEARGAEVRRDVLLERARDVVPIRYPRMVEEKWFP